MLIDYLDKRHIIINLGAHDLRSALHEMLKISKEKAHSELIDKIMERENLMTTALGKGIAIPRIVVKNKRRSEIIIALSTKGVKAQTLDLLSIKMLFLCLFSEYENHAEILAHILRLLNDDTLRSELLRASSAEECYNTIYEWEHE